MAEAAERCADGVVVTRGPSGPENPMAAIGEMMRGFRHPCRVCLEPSRRRAVSAALECAEPRDVVLLISADDGVLERRAVRGWFLEALEAEALSGSVGET
jgi:UDP-N-acetylmuramyl tripeptide synthase